MSGYDLINIDSLDQLDCFSYTKNFCNFVVKALSSAWCENNLFLGSTDGIIAKYVFIETDCGKFEPRYEGFCVISKKQQITKLEAVKHCNILICHCGGNVHLLSRTELKIIKSIEGVYKNISLYFFKGERGIRQNPEEYYLGLSSNKNIKIFHMENHNIINVVSTPNLKRYIYRFLFLDSKNILILHSDGYYKYDIILLKYSPIILETTAKSQIPYVCQIFFDSKNCQWPPYMDDIIIPSVEYKNNTIKSLIDNNDIVCMLFITEAYRTHIFIYFGNGSFHQIYLMKWNESPLAVEFSFPYVVAFYVNGRVDVRYENIFVSNLFIEKLSIIKIFRDVDYINKSHEGSNQLQSSIFILSQQTICRLYQLPMKIQLNSAELNGYNLIASFFANYLDLSDESNYSIYTKIKKKCALAFFANRKYKKCFNIFTELKTDIASVVNLIPGILLKDFKPLINLKLESSVQFPTLKGGDLEIAVANLIDYLTDIRFSLPRTDPNNLQYKTTTNILLHCYILTNPQIVLPLLSLPNNPSLVDEIEQLLKEHKLYKELAYYYLNKQRHCQAISVLKVIENDLYFPRFLFTFLKSYQINTFEIFNQYCENICERHSELIFDFLSENLPSYCLEYLEQVCTLMCEKMPTYSIPFMEILIYKWKNTNSWCHNLYISLKTNHLQLLLKKFYATNQKYVHPGKEDSLLAAEHKLFIDLLINNNFYDPHKILLNFSYINFHFERLIIYDKINETRIGFEDILEKTNDHSLLEEFCIQMYDIKRAKGVLSEDCSKSIFILVELFFEMAQTDNNYSKTGIEFFLQNLDLLTHQQISNIVCKFPDNYTVKQLYPILSKSFIKYINQFHLSLAMSQNATQAASKMLFKYFENSKNKITTNNNTHCLICKKIIGLSSFVVQSNGLLIHHHCFK